MAGQSYRPAKPSLAGQQTWPAYDVIPPGYVRADGGDAVRRRRTGFTGLPARFSRGLRASRRAMDGGMLVSAGVLPENRCFSCVERGKDVVKG